MQTIMCWVMVVFCLNLTFEDEAQKICKDGSCGDHETYRIVNKSDFNADFSIEGNGKKYSVSLKPHSWCSVRAEGKVDKRLIVRSQETKEDHRNTSIQFDRIPDESGIGIPVVYIDGSNHVHLLRLGKSSLVLLDRETNEVLDDASVPASYVKNWAKKHTIYDEKELAKK